MKLLVEAPPYGLRVMNVVEADIFKADDCAILQTNDDAFDYTLELDYSLLLAFEYKLRNVIRQDRTRGAVIQLIKDECDVCPKERIRIIWDAGVTMRVYQSLSKILRSRISSHAHLPFLNGEPQAD